MVPLAGGWLRGTPLFSVKVQLWLHTAQGELWWLWHKSSGAIWLILLQLHKTSRGHKPPKQGSTGVCDIILSSMALSFSHANDSTPLVSSTLILLLLLKSFHKPSLHPPNLFLSSTSLTPHLPLLGGYCFCLWLTAHYNPSELQVCVSSHGITGPHNRWQLTASSAQFLTALILLKGEILNLSDSSAISQKMFKNKR